jgi:arsenite-transporting ATPase
VRTLLFTGKGGVGKTTIAAATALRCASLGYETLIISTDAAHNLADALATPLGNEPSRVSDLPLDAAELDTTAELERYWGEIKRRIAAALRQEGVEATVAGELSVLPGLDEVLALVRIKRYHDEGRYQVLVIDSAPTGAAMRLLSAPDLSRWYTRGLLGLSRGVTGVLLSSLRAKLKVPLSADMIEARVGELFAQIEALRAILSDSAQTSVRLVLNPERMALLETQRAYTYMNLFGLAVDALFVNRVLPDEVTDPFFADIKAQQAHYRQEIKSLFAPLPVFEVPLMRQEVNGCEQLAALASQLYGDVDPTISLSTEQPLRFYLEGGRYMLALRVSGVAGGNIQLESRGDELHVRLGTFRRSLILPQYLAGLKPTWARLEGDYLKIAFEEHTS